MARWSNLRKFLPRDYRLEAAPTPIILRLSERAYHQPRRDDRRSRSKRARSPNSYWTRLHASRHSDWRVHRNHSLGSNGLAMVFRFDRRLYNRGHVRCSAEGYISRSLIGSERKAASNAIASFYVVHNDSVASAISDPCTLYGSRSFVIKCR